MSAFDDFTRAFADFMESGTVNELADYCDSGVNADRLNIYRNGYFRSAIDTLVSNYPAVYVQLGNDTFRHLAKQFVIQYPPIAGTLVGYGVEFPKFLEAAYVSRELPYLPDIARLDSGWLQVYFSADREPLSPVSVSELISEFGEAGLQKIGLVPAVALVSLRYPISAVWQLLKDNARLDSVIKLTLRDEHTLIWRAGSIVLVRVLPASEYAFFSNLLAGLSFEEAAGLVADTNEEFDMSLLFSDLITSELLAIKTSPDTNIKFKQE